ERDGTFGRRPERPRPRRGLLPCLISIRYGVTNGIIASKRGSLRQRPPVRLLHDHFDILRKSERYRTTARTALCTPSRWLHQRYEANLASRTGLSNCFFFIAPSEKMIKALSWPARSFTRPLLHRCSCPTSASIALA